MALALYRHFKGKDSKAESEGLSFDPLISVVQIVLLQLL
jgi:hypothetical protein